MKPPQSGTSSLLPTTVGVALTSPDVLNTHAEPSRATFAGEMPFSFAALRVFCKSPPQWPHLGFDPQLLLTQVHMPVTLHVDRALIVTHVARTTPPANPVLQVAEQVVLPLHVAGHVMPVTFGRGPQRLGLGLGDGTGDLPGTGEF
jgi:hypothetical protein